MPPSSTTARKRPSRRRSIGTAYASQKIHVLDFCWFLPHGEGVQWWMFVLAGAGVGVTFGLFGAGGSAFATPILALMGVPPVLAVASPLPALLPSSVVGAREYLKAGMLDRRVARI